MSCYMNSDTVLIAFNRIVNPGIVQLTLQQGKNIVLFGNLLIHGNENGNILMNWGTNMTGTNFIINNTIQDSVNHASLGLPSGPAFHLINNIIDGSNNLTVYRETNLYTGLEWDQHPARGWAPGPGEIVEPAGSDYAAVDPSSVYSDPNGDFCLKSGSRAMNKGQDVRSYMAALASTDSNVQTILAAFPDFDWTKDILGNTRGSDGSWDIGAYEYCEGAGCQAPPTEPELAAQTLQSYVFPSPVRMSENPTLHMEMGAVDNLELTIFNAIGRVVHSANLTGSVIGGAIDYSWRGPKSFGVYYAVIYGKSKNGALIKTKCRFAVIP
jgi:hypothetical protein